MYESSYSWRNWWIDGRIIKALQSNAWNVGVLGFLCASNFAYDKYEVYIMRVVVEKSQSGKTFSIALMDENDKTYLAIKNCKIAKKGDGTEFVSPS